MKRNRIFGDQCPEIDIKTCPVVSSKVQILHSHKPFPLYLASDGTQKARGLIVRPRDTTASATIAGVYLGWSRGVGVSMGAGVGVGSALSPKHAGSAMRRSAKTATCLIPFRICMFKSCDYPGLTFRHFT